MEYEQLSKGYRYGLQKIYEMVINNDPCYAYLLRCNQMVDQKLVMAHVYGHNDFFKNNITFSHTNRKMMDEMANHGNRIRRYMERHGEDEVEDFIDSCLSLENLIDIHSPFIKRRDESSRYDFGERGRGRAAIGPAKFQNTKDYMDSYINPPGGAAGGGPAAGGGARGGSQVVSRAAGARRAAVLCWSMRRLKGWQHDVLAIIRDEAYYFAPQAATKIMNEGWASYWHSTIMTTKLLGPSEVVDYADHHSGTMATYSGRLNPVQAGDRAVPGHRGALEQGAIRARVGGVRERDVSAGTGTSSSDWAGRRSSRCARSTTTSRSSTRF